MIDDLQFSYQENGNQLLSIRDDGEDADMYSTIEYHSAGLQTDTAMYYDANGNLISDLDRGISSIKYNLLNLPDTIQFINGNQIVNLYDASGRKYKSIIYTNLSAAITPCYEIVHYTSNTDSVEYRVTEYVDNVEYYYTPRDTTSKIFNAVGYYTDSAYFYYVKDHLGNICAVVNVDADSVIQRTMYYASGVPMAASIGRDEQPYLYNGKEFVEAHGWHTYDYGFRGYYAPIGRFTSIDPLAEQTPWQSPYAYAGNNFINAIDWMGLSGMTTEYYYTEINNQGIVICHIDNDDNSVMLNGEKIGTELEDEDYIVGWRAFFKHDKYGVIMIYNYNGGQHVRRSTPWEKRVEIWLRAQKIDKMEETMLEYEQSFIQEIVLWIPILSQYNDMLVLINGENIYGHNADVVDKEFALVSLLTLGASRLVSIKQAKEGFDLFNNISDFGAFVKSVLEDYGIISQEDN